MKRTRRTKAKRERSTQQTMERLDAALLDILAADWPQSVRHCFYRAVSDPALEVPKSKSGYGRVQRSLAAMREDGRLDWRRVVDHTRRAFRTTTFNNPADFVRSVASLYRRSLWDNGDHLAEVWVESSSVAAVLEDDTDDLGVSLVPCRGYPSISLVRAGAQELAETARDRQVCIGYVGDADDHGYKITANVEQRLREYATDAGLTTPIRFERLAVTEEQIKDLALPTDPDKPGSVQAEAIPAAVLRGLVRDWLESFLDPRAMEVVRVAEEAERRQITDIAAFMERVP